MLVEAPSGRFGRRRAFAVTVSCPEGTSVEAKSASADLRARGRLGEVTMRNASGDVAVELRPGSGGSPATAPPVIVEVDSATPGA